MSEEITESIARRVLEIVDAGLVAGLGGPVPGQMCVEAAVCYALGLPHGDDPACVSPAVRRLAGRLNDARWTSPHTRARGLRRLAIAQLGTAGSLDEREFVRRVARLAIQFCVPAALRAAAQCCVGTQRDRLLQAADLCARDPSREHALEAHAAAEDAATDACYAAAVADAAADAYAAVADADAYYAADAADEAAEAADAAAYAAYAASYGDAAGAAAAAADAYSAAAVADAHLSDFAEGVVQILIDMGAPGCAFLHLTEVA